MNYNFNAYANRFASLNEKFYNTVEKANSDFVTGLEQKIFLPVEIYRRRNEAASAVAESYKTSCAELNAQAVAHVDAIREMCERAMSYRGDAAYYNRVNIDLGILSGPAGKDYMDDKALHDLTAEYSADFGIMKRVHGLVERLVMNEQTMSGKTAFPIRNLVTGWSRFPETFRQYYADCDVLDAVDEVAKCVQKMYTHGYREKTVEFAVAGANYYLWVPDTQTYPQLLEEHNLPGLLDALNTAILAAKLNI